jgi:hypothetical protein
MHTVYREKYNPRSEPLSCLKQLKTGYASVGTCYWPPVGVREVLPSVGSRNKKVAGFFVKINHGAIGETGFSALRVGVPLSCGPPEL